MSKINVRSPYFVNLSTTNLESATLEIRIYKGAAETTWLGSPQYTLTSTAINEKVNFEIAELIKDYIPAAFNGVYPNDLDATEDYTTMYVDYRVTETLSTGVQSPVVTLGLRAFYGYGYFEEGANPQLLQGYLQSNTTILKLHDAPIRIPVDNENTNSVVFLYQGQQVYSWLPSTGLKIQDQIVYVSNGVNGADSFEERVELDGGTFEDNACINEFEDDFELFPVDEVLVSGVEGLTIIKIDNIDECKYTPYKLTFINKFGAYQDIWMFKNSKLAMTTEKDKYKSNILNNGTYETYNAQVRLLSKNANQRLTLNSGYYPESNNEIFRQLFLSDKVWIEYKEKTLAVNIENNNIDYKTSLTDSLINYTIDVSFAFDTINNIR
jgi:hypothetical protein